MSSLRVSILAALLAMSYSGCDKEPTGPGGNAGISAGQVDSSKLPKVITQSPRKVTRIQATCGGHLFLEGGSELREMGVCWSTHPHPTIADDHAPSGYLGGNFEIAVGNLRPGTTYHVRAYATNDLGTGYGEDLEFTTSPPLPTPTCVADTNTVNYDGSWTSFRSVSGIMSEDIGSFRSKIWASSAFSELEMHFTRPPKPGLYETRSSDNAMDLDSTQVVVEALFSGQIRSARDGGTVKIDRLPDGRTVAAFCDLQLGLYTADKTTSQGLIVTKP
jgi:hypothetical protein